MFREATKMNPEEIDRLEKRGFSEKAILLVAQKINIGRLKSPTGYAKVQSADGDVMELYLAVESGVIQEARYLVSGYAGLIASASGLTEMIRGMNINEAEEIEVPELIDYVGGLPPSDYACAALARDTLRQAIKHVNALCARRRCRPRRACKSC